MQQPTTTEHAAPKRDLDPDRTRGDDYADGDALADIIPIARRIATSRNAGYCHFCLRTECPAWCVGHDLKAWIARIDDNTPAVKL